MKSTWYIFVFIQTLLTYIIKLSWRKALILFYSLSINTINSLFVNTLKTLIHVYKWVSNLVSNSSLHKHTIRLSIGTNILIHWLILGKKWILGRELSCIFLKLWYIMTWGQQCRHFTKKLLFYIAQVPAYSGQKNEKLWTKIITYLKD